MNNEPNKKNGAKPAVAHKKNILDDRRIRLALSVLGAIVAWMVVTIIVQPGTSNTIYNVPVDYTYDSAAYTSRWMWCLTWWRKRPCPLPLPPTT